MKREYTEKELKLIKQWLKKNKPKQCKPAYMDNPYKRVYSN